MYGREGGRPWRNRAVNGGGQITGHPAGMNVGESHEANKTLMDAAGH